MFFKRKKMIKIFDPRVIINANNVGKKDRPLATFTKNSNSLIIIISPYNWLNNFGLDFIYDIISNYPSDEIVIDTWEQIPEIFKLLKLEEVYHDRVGFNRFEKDKLKEMIKLLNQNYDKLHKCFMFGWFIAVYPEEYNVNVRKLVPDSRIYDQYLIYKDYSLFKERDTYFKYHIKLSYDMNELIIQCNRHELFDSFIKLTKKYSEVEIISEQK